MAKTIQKNYPEIEIKKLKLAYYNPREMPEKEYESLKKSMKEFGCVEPVVMNTHKGREGIVVGGNMRARAATELGWKTIPYTKVDLPEDKEKLLNLALNRIKGEWDETKLAELVYNLSHIDADLNLSGFNEVEISNLLDTQMLLGEEEPESEYEAEQEMLKKEPQSKYGEIYKLGRHKLMCGDATKTEDIKKLMGKEQADMVFTDPPYNVAHISHAKAGKFHREKGTILGDQQSQEEFQEFCRKFFNNCEQILKPGKSIYICTGYTSYPLFYYQMLNAGFEFSTTIVWVKPSFSIGWRDYKNQYEQVMKGKKGKGRSKAQPIIYGWKSGQRHYFYGDLNESDVWEMPRKTITKMLHPTEKPEWLIMKAVKNSTRVGQLVADLFAGCGSTMMAAHKLERTAYMMELDPYFCDIIRKRWARISQSPKK